MRRIAAWALGILLLLLVAAGAGYVFLDTAPGHRFLIRQIEQLAPESGLRIRVARIEGSIYGRAQLRDLELYDPRGRFFAARTVELDWSPLLFLTANRLDIDSATAPRATLDRLPELIPSVEPQPILPDFDIRVAALRIDRLTLGPTLGGGTARTARVVAKADIAAGRAMIDADARLLDGADRVTLKLDSVPDANRFDLTADVVAPGDGVLVRMAGLPRGMAAAIRGKGTVGGGWTGALVARDAGVDLARLALDADGDRYRVNGVVHAERLADGMIDRVAPTGVRVDIDGRFADRVFSGSASAAMAALRLDATGGVDLARSRWDNLRLDARIIQPSALLNAMRGDNLRAQALIEGAMATPRFEYRVTADRLAFGTTVFAGVLARGQGQSLDDRTIIPVDLAARRVTGTGELGDSILANLRAAGSLTLKDGIVTSDLIRVTTDRIDGRVAVLANLAESTYNIGFDGALNGLEIPGLGRIDLVSKLTALPATGGGARIAGNATVQVRRFDNAFLAGLAGGLPRLSTNLSLGPDGILRLPGLRITAPLLNLTADGFRRADGTFSFTGRGRHATYGPLTATLDGRIDRPRVQLVLASPLPSAGLANVRLTLDPTASGFSYDAAGQSVLGPFVSAGSILLPSGGQTVIAIDTLRVAGTTASGRLVPVAGGLAGNLAIAGGGVDGTLRLGMAGGVQEIVAALAARDARFPGPPAISIRRGELNAVLRLLPGGASVDANATLTGFRRGNLSIARLAGTAKLIGGRGIVRGSMAGTRGRNIDLQVLARIAPGAIDLDATGRISGRPVKLTRTARLRAEGDGWRVRNAVLSYGGGTVALSGLFGGATMDVNARLDRLPLHVIDLLMPENRLGGRASGTLVYRDGPGGQPTGSTQLRVVGLTRAGLGGTIQPVDVALNAALSETSLAMRAVVGADGKTFGRVQARVSPLGGGTLVERIQRAPVRAQLRYDGRAETLWALSGVDALAISGPLQVAADMTGTVGDPSIRGVLRTDNGRIESLQAGTVVTNVRTVGRFDGSRLELAQLSGSTPGGGTVEGRARFDLSVERGFPYDVQVQATNALLIDRDDFAGRVTGPIRMQADATGGLITGDVRLDQGRFRLGTAGAANALPVIQVREINLPADRPEPRAAAAPLRLAIKARGRNQLVVTGMGLESEWSTDLNIGGSVAEMRITGEANLVRGDYTFAGRRFELESGRIRFLGNSPIDPLLDIKAVSDVTGIDATINVRGTGQRPEISFSSVPALPEDELLSRILFGASITDISVAEAAQLAAAVASLRGGGDGLDPINSLRRGLGLDRLRILPADSSIGQRTSIAAGKYLTRRLFVEIITDGQGYSATRAEFQVTRWLSILSAISTVGRQSVNVRVQRDY